MKITSDWAATIDSTLHYVVTDVPESVSPTSLADVIQEVDLLFKPPTVTPREKWDSSLEYLTSLAGPRDTISWERLSGRVEGRRGVLSTIYGPFHETSEWPTYQYVSQALMRSNDLDLAKVLPTLPRGWVIGGDTSSLRDTLVLSVPALAFCPGAEGDVELFLDFLHWAIMRDSEFVPSSPSVFEEVRLSSKEFLKARPAGQTEVDAHDLRRLFKILETEPDIVQDQAYQSETDEWIVSLSDNIRSYRGVETITDYLLARPAVARRRGWA